MVEEFVPPRWTKMVIVGGDAAYGSKANMRMVKDRDKRDTARRWGFVFAIARTWKMEEDKAIEHLVTHLPRKFYQRAQIPRENAGKYRTRTFWMYGTSVSLHHVGDVTVVLSKKGRNVSRLRTARRSDGRRPVEGSEPV